MKKKADSVPQLMFIPWAVCSSVQRCFHLSPEILNRVHIRAFRWPRTKEGYIVVLKPVPSRVSTMSWSIVLHELHLVDMCIYEREKATFKCLLSIPTRSDIALKSDNFTFALCTDGCPYHYALSWSILMDVRRQKAFIFSPIASNSAVFFVNNKTFFIRPYDAGPLPQSPSSMSHCPCKSIGNMKWAKSLFLNRTPAS